MSKKVAVVLSGSGVYDGSEIHESVFTLLALAEAGAEVQAFAPNCDQMHVVNHLTGEVADGETRNVLVESARIMRGNVLDIAQANVEEFDALIVPGGFGAAKNLSDFAVAGSGLTVNPDFLALAKGFHDASKPIGLICISPTMTAAICGEGAECTIGTDPETAAAVNATGAKHVDCEVTGFHVDEDKKLVTTPAYMLASNMVEAKTGIDKLVSSVLSLA